VFGVLKKFQPTIFYGVPTLYAALLADPAKPAQKSELRLRVCTSAGEALPAEIGKKLDRALRLRNPRRHRLHRDAAHLPVQPPGPGALRHHRPGGARLPLRIIGDDGRECGDGEIGELQISGPSAAIMYWNNRAKTKATFAGEWTKSGDKYTRDADGYYTYGGRSDDMLKVGGIYVSPFEVEACLMTHAAVLEVAVIGVADSDGSSSPRPTWCSRPARQPPPTTSRPT
jgi:benzoate-CoA ligase